MRHSRTSRHAARAARALVAAGGVVLASYCTEPTQRSGPEGLWVMVAVDGSSLPAVINPDETMLSGDLDLIGDGTYVKRATASVTGVEFHASSTGRWSVRGDLIEFTSSTGNVQIGQWRDGAIVIQDVRTTRYVPASAVPPIPRSTARPALPGGTPPERRPHFSALSSLAGSARP